MQYNIDTPIGYIMEKDLAMNKSCNNEHPEYKKYLPRIGKMIGQLNGIKNMIDERRYCPEIINQLKAVSAASQSLQALLLEEHLESCIVNAFKANNKIEQRKKIQELTALYKK